MVEMMNTNVAAYLMNYLVDSGLPIVLVKRLLTASVDPILVLDVGNCTWDKETKTLTTPNDDKNDANLELEKAAWYTNGFGMKMGQRWLRTSARNRENL